MIPPLREFKKVKTKEMRMMKRTGRMRHLKRIGDVEDRKQNN